MHFLKTPWLLGLIAVAVGCSGTANGFEERPANVDPVRAASRGRTTVRAPATMWAAPRTESATVALHRPPETTAVARLLALAERRVARERPGARVAAQAEIAVAAARAVPAKETVGVRRGGRAGAEDREEAPGARAVLELAAELP